MNLTLSDIKKREPAPIGEHRFFSVLVPFVEKDGELYILYEVRAKAMASQPGETCFPGGHVEAGESPRDCALRETFEEIGIPAEKISLMGAGNILYGYANYTLYTYLGAVDYETYCSAKLQKDEVDEIFLVRLSDFEKHPPKVFSEKVYTEIDKDFPYEEVGIREGEKLHEIMITAEDARRTYEYDRYYVIYPELAWFQKYGQIYRGYY